MSAQPYSHREEILHSATAGLGILASAAAIPWLIVTAVRHGDSWRIVGGIAFGVAALLMFASSALYHAARDPGPKRLLRKLDHSAIFLLIAGTYTPFMIGVLRGAWGWSLFGVVWTVALLGIAAELTGRGPRPILSSALYVAIGWVGILGVRELAAMLTPAELAWLIAGGVLYTCGVPFYVWKSRRYTHSVWHVFVLAGVGCHFLAVLGVMHGA